MPANQSHNCSRSGADEACSRPVRRGQISYAIAPLDQDIVGSIENSFHHCLRRLVSRNCIGDSLETQDQALETLQQRVVQLSRDPDPLTVPLSQSGFHLRSSILNSPTHQVQEG